MKKAASEYVFKRDNGIYCFRRSVPLDIREKVGKREWKVSLRTRDKGLANEKAAALSKKLHVQIAQYRGEAHAETTVDPEAPASDEQVIAALNRLLARDKTIRTGRLDGKIENGALFGNDAKAQLESLIQELEELSLSTPLALDTTKLNRFMPRLEKETGRVPETDKRLMRKLAASYLQNEKQIIEIKIAQIQGDERSLEKLKKQPSKQRDLQFLIDLYKEQKGALWRPKTRTKFENISRIMLDVLGPRTKISSVNRDGARDFSDIIHSLPTNYSQRKDLAGLSARDAARSAKSRDYPTLGYKSVKIILSYASSIFEFAVNEDLIDKNPMRGLEIRIEQNFEPTKKPTPEQIQKMFSAPVFTGCLDDVRNWRIAAPTKIRRGRFWVPILALHTGMRLGEICSLQAKDIQTLHGVKVFKLVNNEERRLKTKNAARAIPIHRNLEKIGFSNWLDGRSFSPEDYIFSELPLNSKGNRSDAFSKWFGRFRKSLDLGGKSTTMHSMRHLFSDLLKATNAGEMNVKLIMGWAQGGMLDVYGDSDLIELFDTYVQKIDFGDYDISHLADTRR